MRGQVFELARRYIDGINLGFRNATDLAAVCVECLAIRTPGHRAPGVALVGFTRQPAYFLGTRVQQSDVIVGGLFRLNVQSDCLAIARPKRALLAYIRSVGQIHWCAAIARHRIQIPQFVPSCVLLIYDPLTVRGPRCAVLTIIGLRKLERPSTRSAYLP